MLAQEAKEIYLQNQKYIPVCCPITPIVAIICINIEAESKLSNYRYIWFHDTTEQAEAVQIGIALTKLGYEVIYNNNYFTITWK